MSALYIPPNPINWQGRSSSNGAYLHEIVQMLNLETAPLNPSPVKAAALLGYACDEGVARNQGRPGAAKGPKALRSAMGKLPWHQPEVLLADTGDISLRGTKLKNAQESFSNAITRLMRAGYIPLGIGGGHDIAYAHYSGILRSLPEQSRLGVVNFDAHFDLRLPEPKAHSGSPFYQMALAADACDRSFRYACIGARKDANPKELWQRAEELGVLVVERREMHQNTSNLDSLQSFLNAVDAVYLSIDLDGFASAYAPGVSAASPWGFSPIEMYPYLDCVLKSGKVVAADLAELNPAYDRDGQTAALAAGLLHRILHHPGLF